MDRGRLDRRTLLKLGFAGASTLVLAQAGYAAAVPEEKAPKPEVKDVDIKTGKEVESMIPGFQKVRLREFTFKPGGRTKATMENAMICECSQGALQVTQDGKTFTANKGRVWTCRQRMVEETVNKGKGAAVMRVFDLLT